MSQTVEDFLLSANAIDAAGFGDRRVGKPPESGATKMHRTTPIMVAVLALVLALVYFGRREFVEGNLALVPALLDVLQTSGKQAMDNPKKTTAFLAPKLGLTLAVMERSEARRQRYGGEPLSGQAVADQQAVADTFFKRGLIPKAIRVEELVYHPAK